jgi:hypothetical protein
MLAPVPDTCGQSSQTAGLSPHLDVLESAWQAAHNLNAVVKFSRKGVGCSSFNTPALRTGLVFCDTDGGIGLVSVEEGLMDLLGLEVGVTCVEGAGAPTGSHSHTILQF